MDMFYECEDPEIENYADDTTLYICAFDIKGFISELQIASKLFTWFNNNHMRINPENKPPSFGFQYSKKSLFWWSLGRIKFN